MCYLSLKRFVCVCGGGWVGGGRESNFLLSPLGIFSAVFLGLLEIFFLKQWFHIPLSSEERNFIDFTYLTTCMG